MYQWLSFVLMSALCAVFSTNTARAALLDILNSESITITRGTHQVGAENSQTLTLLQAAKNIDPCLSKGGGDVVVRDDKALESESTPFAEVSQEQVLPPASDQISLYLVQDGDTLSQVSEMFNVSVNTVVWANELSHSMDIHPGQTLLILPISGLQHTVAKGDTLKSIAKEYGGDSDNIEDFVTEIREFNNLEEGASLAVGEIITVPGGEMDEEVPVSYAATTASGPSVSGYFINPVSGWSVKTQGLHGYNAVDFGANYGTPVVAAANGTVIVSRVGGWNGGYGNYVVIEHANGTQTLYSHNSRNAVWQGQRVVQGQVIGYIGSTGRSTGNHLHFEVRGAKNPF